MRVFISWSGEQSRLIAEALRDWLPDVIQSLNPWISTTDIESGRRWNHELSQILENSQVGLLCITQQNLNASWLLFEAGALAKSTQESLVIPYLTDIGQTDVTGPLAQFQAQIADAEGTYHIVQTINNQLPADTKLPEAQLTRTFHRWWPDLESKLNRISKDLSNDSAPPRQERDILEEILQIVRFQSKSTSSSRWKTINHLQEVLEGQDSEVNLFAEKVSGKLKSSSDSEEWFKRVPPSDNPLNGQWYSRWTGGGAKDNWRYGVSYFAFFPTTYAEDLLICHKDFDHPALYIIAARQQSKNRYIGRFYSLKDPSDTTPWVGIVVDSSRIDGWWPLGQWDFHR